MRKKILHESAQIVPPADAQDWLDLEHLIRAELTSEDSEHPIESLQTLFSHLLIEMDQNLCIRLGIKRMPLFL